jgi:hypothetical protein
MDIENDFENVICFKEDVFVEKNLIMSNDVKNILGGELDNFNLALIVKAYKLKLDNRGYTVNKISWKKINENFINFYTSDFLDQINYSLKVEKSNNSWLKRVLFNNCYVNKIKHILFIRFLFGGISELKSSDFEIRAREDYDFEFVNIIQNSPNTKSYLLKELHMTINVAFKKSKQYGIQDVFLKKMEGYFDAESVKVSKKKIENFVRSYDINSCSK